MCRSSNITLHFCTAVKGCFCCFIVFNIVCAHLLSLLCRNVEITKWHISAMLWLYKKCWHTSSFQLNGPALKRVWHLLRRWMLSFYFLKHGVYSVLLLPAALLLFIWGTAANEFELYLWNTAKQRRTQKIFMGGFRSVAYGGRLFVVCVLCDVTIWRYIHVSKPTFWRSLLT